MSTDNNTPYDWDDPNFDLSGIQVHEWKSYATESIIDLWDTFNNDQKKAVSSMLQDVADREDWD